jgi:hypothetical protein
MRLGNSRALFVNPFGVVGGIGALSVPLKGLVGHWNGSGLHPAPAEAPTREPDERFARGRGGHLYSIVALEEAARVGKMDRVTSTSADLTAPRKAPSLTPGGRALQRLADRAQRDGF